MSVSELGKLLSQNEMMCVDIVSRRICCHQCQWRLAVV